MAVPDRQPPPGLTDRAEETQALAALLHAPERFDIFAALRLVEAAFPQRARLGEGRRARDEPARLRQPPFVTFPPSHIADAQQPPDGPLRLSQYVFGLFGPQGPLPLHVTVRALQRQRQMQDRTLAHFADIFHHRLVSLFYRAWARARPTVERDRPASDRFARRVGALAGAPTPDFAGRSLLPDAFVLYAAGLLAMQNRPPEALQRLIALLFDVPARICEFVDGWLELEVPAQARLGGAREAWSGLGEAVVGPRVRARQHRFRIVLGPLSADAFMRFLPTGTAMPVLRDLVRRVVGKELEWDVQLVLRHAEVPGARLNDTARLDWTSWLAARERTADSGDVVLAGDMA